MRVLLIGAVVIAAVSLGCSSKTSSSGIDIDRSFRAFLWPDATVLAGADLDALKTTSFYQHYSKQLDIPLLNEASARLGFDPRRDVRTLVLESDSRRSLVLARGELQASEIRQKLSAMGAKASLYHLFPVFGDERNSVAIVSNSMAVGGSGQAVRSALDLHENKSGSVPPDLQTRLETIPKSAQLWIVSSKGLPFVELPMRSDIKSALSNIVAYISGTTVGVQVDSGVKLDAKLSCISPAGAQRVHDALRGGIGLARLSTKDDQVDLLKLYDAIEVNQTGSMVEVKAALNAGEVDKLMTYLPQLTGRAGQLLQ